MSRTRRWSQDSPAAARKSLANRLRKAGLSPVAASLIREDVFGAALPSNPSSLADRIKATHIRLTGASAHRPRHLDGRRRRWSSLNPDFSLKADPATFVCGEMLDWEAPTGGYLLQACFATGRAAAKGAIAALLRQPDPSASPDSL